MTAHRPTSSLSASLLFAAAAASALPACQETNSGFCGDSCADAAVDGRTGCIANPDVCSMTQTCDRNDDMCVDCTPGDNKEDTMECTAAAPVCDTTRACRECRVDSECTGSQFCEGGQCIATENVVYVDTAGTDNATCDINAKCKSPITALSKVMGARKYLHFEPSSTVYSLETPDAALTIAKDVIIHGRGAILERPGGNQIVDVTAGNVVIEGLTIRGAAGGGNADGIKCMNGSVTLREVTVSDNNDRGLEFASCDLDVSRSVIADNGAGGLRFVDGHFSITNSYVFGNRANSGLSLNPNTTPNVLDSNTIVKNTGNGAGGINCLGATAITARNNLIHSNTGPVEAAGANCTHTASVIGTLNPPAGSISLTVLELGLKNLLTGTKAADFHINPDANPASKLEAAGDTSLTVDHDGDRRPNPAGAPDIGADEVP